MCLEKYFTKKTGSGQKMATVDDFPTKILTSRIATESVYWAYP
jgi:hypothetical protein